MGKKLGKTISHRSKLEIRFSDVDSLKVVWHGHFIKFFEDGREAFGKKYGISYIDVHREGYVVPIVKVNCDYKMPLCYGDEAFIETTFVSCLAAKMVFEYRIYKIKEGKELTSAVGASEQVFLNQQNELVLTNPDFFLAWKDMKKLV